MMRIVPGVDGPTVVYGEGELERLVAGVVLWSYGVFRVVQDDERLSPARWDAHDYADYLLDDDAYDADAWLSDADVDRFAWLAAGEFARLVSEGESDV